MNVNDVRSSYHRTDYYVRTLVFQVHYNICVKGKQSSRIESTVSSLKSIHERDGELRNFAFFLALLQ